MADPNTNQRRTTTPNRRSNTTTIAVIIGAVLLLAVLAFFLLPGILAVEAVDEAGEVGDDVEIEEGVTDDGVVVVSD